LIYFELCQMVSSLEKRYLSSTGLSPLRIHFITSLKASGMTITYSGYCHPLPPDISTTTQPKISTVCLSTSEKGSKFLQKLPLKNAEFKKDMRVSFLRKKGEKKKKEEVLMILSKSSAKEEFNKITQKYFQSVSPFLPLP